MGKLIADKFKAWERECNARFERLKSNEEALNRIFIDIYGVRDEMTSDVEEDQVTVRKADLAREIKSLISYAVGCMFGRYSLDKDGLCYVGGAFGELFTGVPVQSEDGKAQRSLCYLKEVAENSNVSSHFGVVVDNILPITDDEYFADDIVDRFVEFVRIAYGADTLEENLRFVADALGGKGNARSVIRSYFLKGFYADHLKLYQKHPIYWMFSSGKKNGFKCLIYMHRYEADTLARIRTDYVQVLQARYRARISDTEAMICRGAEGDAERLGKQLKKLQDQAEELCRYEEKLQHLSDQMIEIDLDDGVKVNHAKFSDVLVALGH
ncbi:MAG: hypothetical protein IJ165_12090 [Proteobacteria bacterium]|nr:hypothetical protein [Pseudomonadota bacterium]